MQATLESHMQLYDGDLVLKKVYDDLQKHMEVITRRERVDGIACVILLNWVAPSVVASKLASLQANLMGALLNEIDHGIGIVLCPQFSYTKGQVAKSTAMMLEKLTQANVNLDHAFAITFKERCDQRDERPLMRPGRLGFGLSMLKKQKRSATVG